MMTRKHFEKIAAELKASKPIKGVSTNSALERWEIVVCRMKNMCQDENPRFQASRFLTACDFSE